MKQFLTSAIVLGTVLALPARAEVVMGTYIPDIRQIYDSSKPYGMNLDLLEKRRELRESLRIGAGNSPDLSIVVPPYRINLCKRNLVLVTLPKLLGDRKKLEAQIKDLNDQLKAIETKRKSSLVSRMRSKVTTNPEIAQVEEQLHTLLLAKVMLDVDIDFIEKIEMKPLLTEMQGLLSHIKLITNLKNEQLEAIPPTPIKLPSGQIEAPATPADKPVIKDMTLPTGMSFNQYFYTMPKIAQGK